MNNYYSSTYNNACEIDDKKMRANDYANDQPIYYIAFSLYIMAFFLSITTFHTHNFERILKAIATSFLIIKLLRQRYTLKCALVTGATLLIGLWSWRVTSSAVMPALALFVTASNGVDVKILAKITSIEYSILIAITVSCAYFGFIDSKEIIRISTGKLRSSMGFSHPNRFGSMFLSVVYADAIMRYPHYKPANALLAALAFLAVYFVCDSWTSMLMIAVVPVMAYICGKLLLRGASRSLTIIALSILLLIIFVSLYCTIHYDRSIKWMRILNDFINDRFRIGNRYYVAYPATLIGRRAAATTLQVAGDESVVIDNAYARLLILYGYIPLGIFVIGYVLRYLRSYRVGEFTAVDFGLLICAIAGLTEHNAMLIAMNFCLVALNPWINSGYESVVNDRQIAL